ncbi:MAG: hypothetical protein ABSE15_01240 [Candidatus Bathyarchaeia archaeon]|jgi:hypothetical protein
MDVIKRRLELLKLEGLGINRVEIVIQLSQKYHCTQRTIYNDFETREKWQRSLQGATRTEHTSLKVLNRFEEIYSQAAKRAMSSTDPYVQLAALNLMVKTNSHLSDSAIAPEILHRISALEDKIGKGSLKGDNS